MKQRKVFADMLISRELSYIYHATVTSEFMFKLINKRKKEKVLSRSDLKELNPGYVFIDIQPQIILMLHII